MKTEKMQLSGSERSIKRGFRINSSLVLNQEKFFQQETRYYSKIILFSIMSLFLTIGLPHVGEEPVYTISSLEMYFNKEYWFPTLNGLVYPRPPIYNWFIVGLLHLMGVKHVLIAARLVTICATAGMGAMCFWVAKKIFKSRDFALFSTILFFSGDLIFRRGWIAYSDPLFAFFVFGAIGCLWVSVTEQNKTILFGANVMLVLAYLTKVHTAYLFYGSMGISLLYLHKNRKFLFSPVSIVLHSAAFSVPVLWATKMSNGSGTMKFTLVTAQYLLEFQGITKYLGKLLVNPIACLGYFAPATLFAIWGFYRTSKQNAQGDYEENTKSTKVAWLAIFLGVLPYWLAPQAHIRYLLPLYPLVSLALAYYIWHAEKSIKYYCVVFILMGLLLKIVVACAWLPYEQTHIKGNAVTVAQNILDDVSDEDLYIWDSTSTGLRITAEINQLIWPKAPLVYGENITRGYILSDAEVVPPKSTFIKKYFLGRQAIYLWQKNTNEN